MKLQTPLWMKVICLEFPLNSVADIQRKINISYLQSSKIIKQLEKDKYVVTKKEGRRRTIHLTSFGEKTKQKILDIRG